MDLNPVELCMTVEELEEIYRDENREVQELFSLIKGDDFIIGQEYYQKGLLKASKEIVERIVEKKYSDIPLQGRFRNCS